MASKYILQQSSTQPNGWVLTDTHHGVVITFIEGNFNDTQKVTMLDNKPADTYSVDELTGILREMGDWISRHHGSVCFKHPFGFEYSEDGERLYLYRNKYPKWRMELQGEMNSVRLASSLRKAAEFLIKRKEYGNER